MSGWRVGSSGRGRCREEKKAPPSPRTAGAVEVEGARRPLGLDREHAKLEEAREPEDLKGGVGVGGGGGEEGVRAKG